MRVFVLLVATAVAAYADDRATALFEEGQKLVEAGKIDEGCTKLEESLRIDPAIGTRLNLADCREKQNKLLEAHGLYARVVVEASALRDSVNRSRVNYARDRMTAIGRRLLRVRLHFSSGVTALDDLEIRLGGKKLERTEWSYIQVVEPGSVTVEASASGRDTQRIESSGTAGQELAIEIPMLTSPGNDTPAKSSGFRLRPSYIVAGVGGALVLTGIIIGFSAKSDYDDAVDATPTPPDVEQRVADARAKGNVGTVIGVVGLAAVGTNVYLFIRERRSDHRDRVVVTPTTNGVIGITALGHF